MFQLNLDPSINYAVRYQFHGEGVITRGDYGMTAQSTLECLWFTVSCAADEHHENPKVRLDFIEILPRRKRVGRKPVFRMSRDCMSPSELREAYDAIMDRKGFVGR